MSADPQRDPIILDEAETTQLRSYVDAGRYPLAYRYLYSILQSRGADANTLTWFAQAPRINEGRGSASRFIRTFTANGLRVAGEPAVNLDGVSDDIAEGENNRPGLLPRAKGVHRNLRSMGRWDE